MIINNHGILFKSLQHSLGACKLQQTITTLKIAWFEISCGGFDPSSYLFSPPPHRHQQCNVWWQLQPGTVQTQRFHHRTWPPVAASLLHDAHSLLLWSYLWSPCPERGEQVHQNPYPGWLIGSQLPASVLGFLWVPSHVWTRQWRAVV